MTMASCLMRPSCLRLALLFGLPLAFGQTASARIAILNGLVHGDLLLRSGTRDAILQVKAGDAVDITWRSDRDLQLHLYGYRLLASLV